MISVFAKFIVLNMKQENYLNAEMSKLTAGHFFGRHFPAGQQDPEPETELRLELKIIN